MTWNESKHPRDDEGKFTFKNGGVQSKNFENNKSKTTKLSKGERINALRKILGDKVSPVDYLYPDEKRLEEKIKAGQIIAKSGNTGNSTGAHLHITIKENNTPVNPRKYIEFD